MEDANLLVELKFGSRPAFKELFSRHYRPLIAYMNSYTHDQQLSDDIVQQCFISIWERQKKLNIKSSFRSYLFSVCYNIYIDHYRKESRRFHLFDELKEKALQERIVEDKQILNERIEKLKKIIETLPPKCKKILELNKFHGMLYTEIADAMNISIKTVEAQMGTAYKKIRERFNNDTFILFVLRYFK